MEHMESMMAENMEAGYGATIGIITFKPKCPSLIPGHVSNALTYNFPVRFKIVDVSTLESVLTAQPNYSSLPIYIQAAKELEEKGVKAIVTSCGYLILLSRRTIRSSRHTSFHIKFATSSFGIQVDEKR